jgi:signal transduction histidine kinase
MKDLVASETLMPRNPLPFCTPALVVITVQLLPLMPRAGASAAKAEAPAEHAHSGALFRSVFNEANLVFAGFACLLLLAGLLVLRRAILSGGAAVLRSSDGRPATATPAGHAPALSELHDRIAQLERANEELENFVYIAAHDLKAPLRIIFDLADWLRKDTAEQLSDESEAYLTMLQHRANSMSALLTDLMDYARSVETDEDVRAVDLEALVADVAFLLDPVRQFEIDVYPARSTIFVPKTPLRHILMNLISNAMQHHDRSHGHISITLEQDNERYLFSVADDGPGISSDDRAHISPPFQRSGRPSAQAMNRGLGLVIVKRILTRYGGNIDIAPSPAHARGAEFRFDMPVFKLS